MFLSLALIPGPKYVSLVLVSGPKCVSFTGSGFRVRVGVFSWPFYPTATLFGGHSLSKLPQL